MQRTRLTLGFIALALIAATAGFLFQQHLTEGSEPSARPLRPNFSFPDTNGQVRHISEWDGQVVLLNFWASWCPPCRKELPDFVRLYDDYHARGFTVVGVGIDKRQDLVDFMDSVGVEYPVLVSETDGIRIAQAYGDRLGALPYSVVIDRQGQIVSTHLNLLTYDEVQRVIEPLL